MYCLVEDVRAMIKTEALDLLIGVDDLEEDADREALIVPIIETAIEDASAEIDGYVAKRYPVPLQAPFPTVINKLAKDMAVYNIYSRVGIDETDREKNYLNRYRHAIRFFELLADGKVDLGISTPKQSAVTGFDMHSSKRLFSRDSMKGM